MAKTNRDRDEQTPQQQPRRLTLSVAGLRLGLTYHQTRDLMLSGRLKGEEDGGRFYVYESAVTDYQSDLADLTAMNRRETDPK